jgi:hypothetical protein
MPCLTQLLPACVTCFMMALASGSLPSSLSDLLKVILCMCHSLSQSEDCKCNCLQRSLSSFWTFPALSAPWADTYFLLSAPANPMSSGKPLKPFWLGQLICFLKELLSLADFTSLVGSDWHPWHTP